VKWRRDRNALEIKENKVGTTTVSKYVYSMNDVNQRSGVTTSGTAFGRAASVGWEYASYLSSYGNGNVSEYIHASYGSNVAHYEYGPFGEQTVATGSLSTAFRHRFSTKPLDEETGYYYYGFRSYDPLTGRWMGRDPIGERGGVKLYGMVHNRPVCTVDRLGLDPLGHLIEGLVETGQDKVLEHKADELAKEMEDLYERASEEIKKTKKKYPKKPDKPEAPDKPDGNDGNDVCGEATYGKCDKDNAGTSKKMKWQVESCKLPDGSDGIFKFYNSCLCNCSPDQSTGGTSFQWERRFSNQTPCQKAGAPWPAGADDPSKPPADFDSSKKSDAYPSPASDPPRNPVPNPPLK
jgi:RHS repeat-associated protein